jgi:uncharacterized protein YjgD (DUF1641 family)
MTTLVETSPGIEAKIDALSAQVESMVAEMEITRRRRESADELRTTLMPVAGEAFALATRELESLQADGSIDDLLGLLRRLIASAGSVDKALAALETMTSLLGDAAPLSGEVVAVLIARLAELDEKGYFDFARHSLGVLDRVILAFDEDDIDQLGDNVVLILQTVKEMTQPEVMQMLRRTATAVQSQQQIIANGQEKTPSLLQLMRQMRDPEVRRGLSRAIGMLRVVAADAPEPTVQDMKGDG